MVKDRYQGWNAIVTSGKLVAAIHSLLSIAKLKWLDLAE